MNTYHSKAQELFVLSKKELNNAKQLNSEAIARDACGKAWLATTDAFRGFLLINGLKEKQLPKSERQRHDLLIVYGDEKMRILYRSIRSEIHEDGYYECIINYTSLFEAFKYVKQFMYRCQNGNSILK